MTPPINIDGSQVQDITIDGQSVTEVTMDGTQVFDAIPDSETWQDNRWPTTAGSGSTLTDDVGSLDGSLGGGSWVSGPAVGDFYYAYDGSSVTDLGTDSKSRMATFCNSGEGAWGAWVRLKEVNFEQLAGSDTTSGSNDVGMFTDDSSTNDFRFRISTTNGNNEVTGGDASQYVDSWVPVVYTADGTDMEIYTGDPLSSVASGGVPATASGDLANKFALGGSTDDGPETLDMDIPWFSTTGVTISQAQDWVDNTSEFFP
jgi:hypothetical protein